MAPSKNHPLQQAEMDQTLRIQAYKHRQVSTQYGAGGSQQMPLSQRRTTKDQSNASLFGVFRPYGYARHIIPILLPY